MRISASEVWSIAISAIFIQNLVMVYMLTSNVFYKALKSPVTGLMYGVLVTIATTLASALAWTLDRYLLLPFKLEYLAPLGYILAIVIVELVADFVLLSLFPIFRKELGGLLPASAFNCAVLGLVFINVQSSGFKFFGSVFYGFCAGLGFILVLFIAANAMERVRFSTPPNAFKGLPIALITSGIISLAFMGFTGMKIPY